ncbi:MAG: hypothetical protein HYT70_02145 [Candidatus Aenigmarchaeota archaeon]|nr:hypothetical protein [Candidatus Aenigmarchaeota archaeon]
MDKKFPSKAKLRDVVKNVLSSHLKVSSQEELMRLVSKRLRVENKNFVVSPTRVKRTALEMPEVEVKAKTKKAVKLQKISNCPVCHSKIQPLEVKNLLDRNVLIGYSCTGCKYQSDLEAFMPMKYAFLWKEAKV